MRTYDPADRILYVHLAQEPAPRPAPPVPARDECERLTPGYANASVRARLGPRRADARPALVVIAGGRPEGDGPASGAGALSLAT